ncbi:MAG: CoA-binding protein [Myxococcota bacterium]|nr:CoA-binding protein [Myxococcota bacterium]
MEENREDRELRQLLATARTIAVVGIKDDPREDAHRIPLYMHEHGYRIVPINPKLSEVLGEEAYPSLSELPEAGTPIDIVNLFRASSHVAGHVDEILAMRPRPRAVWMQLGIADGPSAKRLRAENIEVIQDRCIMVDHRRLEIPTV